MSSQAGEDVNDLLTSLRINYDGLNSNIKLLDQQLTSLRHQFNCQAEELKSKCQTVEEQYRRIALLEHNMYNKTEQARSLATINNELIHRLEVQTERVTSLANELKTMTNLRADAVAKLEEQKAVSATLSQKLAEMKEHLEEANEKLSFATKESDAKDAAYKEKIASLTSTIARKDQENQDLLRRINQMAQSATCPIDQVKNQMAQLQDTFNIRIMAMLKERDGHLKQLEEAKTVVQHLKDDLANVNQAHEVELEELKYFYEGKLKEQSSELLFFREELDRISDEVNSLAILTNTEDEKDGEKADGTFQEYD